MIFSLFRVSGHSMEPFLKEGSVVFTLSFFPIKISDVVVVKYDNKKLIKRVIEIKNGKMYLEGDNKKDSLDSKKIGWIDRENILGKVIFKI